MLPALRFIISGKAEHDLNVVKCPVGWLPIGTSCFALSETAPHTTCPNDKDLLEAGTKNSLIPMFSGVCSERKTSAPMLKCPEGGALILSKNKDGEEVFVCESITYQEAVQHPYDKSEIICEDGYDLFDATSQICRATVQTDPVIYECPYNGTLIFDVFNEYSFRSKRGITCEYFLHYKGHIFCPPGYRVWGPPFPEYRFGELLPHHITDDGEDTLKLSPQIDRDVFPIAGFQPRSLVDASCIQLLGIPHEECSELECDNDYVKKTRKIVRKWAYHVKYADPDVAAFLAIPTGMDKNTTFSFKLAPF